MALRQASSGELLALHHHFRRGVGSRSVHACRGHPRPRIVTWSISRIRKAIANQRARNTDSGHPSAGNLEELAELYFEQGNYKKAREALNQAIASRSDSPHAFYLRAKSSLAMGEYAEAIPDLQYVVAKDPKFDYHRATGLLGDAYARTGDLEKAEIYFAPAAQYSTSPETLYNYANYLKLAGKNEEALEWLQVSEKEKNAAKIYEQSSPALVSEGQGPAKRIGSLTPPQLTQEEGHCF